MKYSDLSALALKIAGLVLFVLVLSKMPEHFQSFKSFENAQASTSIVYHLLPWAIVSFACILLILFPYKISNKLIVQPEDTTDKLSDSAIQIIGIRLLGFLLLFWAALDRPIHRDSLHCLMEMICPAGSPGLIMPGL